MHLPINHRLRPHWRLLAGLCGAYLLAFGVLGVVATAGLPLFDRADTHVLGLRANPAFAWLSLLAGGVVLLAAIVGRDLAHWVNLGAGGLFLLVGLAMLALLQTPQNVLNFEVATCVVALLIGTALLTAGLYGKTGTPRESAAEEVLRHSTRPGDKFTVRPESGA
ncbi:DUF4383 domain-containing protein [Catellatospora bangladeshensis]|uniref:DUF4383 domain-containing protein n=1 Tax=Catellatospora bangladeshensis TaxID=310355 RepID=A0A8J3JKK0_9ACTN|nr:DUF4383 domain-containing protein [Catellatospora bangladeshensis]GIF84179.1 hypothetical protein Cba03nite_55280 [Catellatospora bangladeshensis]